MKTTLILLTLALGLINSAQSATQSRDRDRIHVPDRETSADRDRMRDRDNMMERKLDKKELQNRVSGTKEDMEFTRKLRERLMADNQLSTNGKNINIVTAKESVMLNGSVANEGEKIRIENHARAMAGNKKVESNLTY